MVLAVILLTTATAWAQSDWTGDGTESSPYLIQSCDDLRLLADRVNSGTSYSGMYFKLMNNLDFSPSSTWNDINSDEHNFNPIGKEVGFYKYSFQGTFDGNDKTISGIRIYKDTNDDTSSFVGIFGFLKGTVKKLTLTNTRISGFSYAGGIVGYSDKNSVVDHCTVTSTVAIYAIQPNADHFGGIVGNAVNKTATITNNTSSATVAVKDGLGACNYYGGILGSVATGATVSNNLAIGAKVKDSSGKAGAIMGEKKSSANITNNYYINCTVNGTANALNVGCPTEDLTENCAAVSLHMLTLAADVTTTTPPSVNIGGTDYYGHGTTITLSTTPPATYVGYIYDDNYIVNGTTNSGNTFTMPAQDTEVTSSFTTVPIYKLTLADGITATGTIAATYGDDNYYLAGTTITLSGTQTSIPPVGYIYDGYAVNGTAISGSTFTMPTQETEVSFVTIPVYPLTLADGITTTTTPTITFDNTPYYLAGTTITLSTAQPATYIGYINGDGYTVNGTAISGSTFTMPAQNTSVMPASTIPIYKLTLADGITATGTIAATYGDDNYYLAGTDITLSGGLPEVSAEDEYAAYTVNGEKITGNSFTMPAEAVTVSAAIFTVEWTGEGTESSPYLIQSSGDLMLLAYRVNNAVEDADGEPYKNKWYKLVADLQFDYAGLGETESNFEAIGNNYPGVFNGHFLGNGHTISGIRIRKGSEDNQGLFGYAADNAVISGVILTDADITGKSFTGGIVGHISYGTVTDCHVTNTVIIRATADGSILHGGIVGSNSGTVSGCTSAATLTVESGATDCFEYGGIAGYNNDGTLSDNMALGVHLSDIDDFGAITGNKFEGTLLRNYYSGCTKEDGGEVYGFDGKDITDNDGAVPGIALYDHSVFSGLNSQTLQAVFNEDGTPTIFEYPCVALLGRTLYKNGNWNTLCLPFNVDDLSDTPLAGATVMELDIDGTYDDGHQTGLDGTTLYLYFKPATSIKAGRPYIVKWETTGEPIENPVFQDVRIDRTVPGAVTSQDGKVQFKGIYDPTQLSKDDRSNLCLGAENQLYWPAADEALNALRAYFHVNGTVLAIQSNAAFAFTVEWTGDGTESSPYLIQSCVDLRLLAWRVNNAVEDADGEPYSYKWYKLVADLQFDYADLGETESNFEAIANGAYLFNGHFLGNGHTISGIRIRQGNKNRQGLFGFTEYSEISGVILTDADITGKSFTGGIVGFNGVGGTVTDCHVTSTVIIRATENEASQHGGIVGVNGYGGTVSGCTSAATLTVKNDATGCYCFGGIAGYNDGGTLNDNMALGVHLPNSEGFGAIIGNYSGETMLRNYYNYCTKEGDDMVYGCHGKDITDNDGAVPGIALYDHSVFSCLNSRILQTVFDPGCNFTAYPSVALLGRTLYKDGNWNTLCLPFNVVSINNSPLADATMMELDEVDKWTMEDGQWIIDNENGTCQTGLDGTTLYLYFKPATRIDAGKLYIVKWETNTEGTKGTEDTEIKNPVFRGVEIRSTEPSNVISQDGKVQFKGIYDRTLLQKDGGSNLCFGDDSQLYWPSADEALNAFRAYLHVDGTVQAIQSNSLFALMGDVNGNGGIDIGDAVCIVNYLVNKNNTVFKDQLADLNGNGGIDIGDAVMIVNILVGKTNSSQTTGKGLQTIEEGLQTTDNNEPQ